MAWIVDTSVLLDVFPADSEFAETSARCLSAYQDEGLVVCPISVVQLSPSFDGDQSLISDFLDSVGGDPTQHWQPEGTLLACKLWTDYIIEKHAGVAQKRVIADILIEAFASRFQGLITRNPRHFTTVPVIVPLELRPSLLERPVPERCHSFSPARR